ncbi:ABC transporter permease [uncultured Oscillibacter sp.]|uniref:ABC transporter permease n=1 Tax=uncultured Oscillibacter sp. TaxID=876091 RepID=UPI0026378962|nr:ABC transporter permease [uncultured Oscillibacter sp.]
MFQYIVKRIFSSILVLLGVVTITFFIARVLPSSPEVRWAGQRATEEQLEAARIELGLDKSLPEQYVIYLRDLLRGNLGKSLNNHQPVTSELRRYVPATLELVLLAFALAVVIGIPLGIYSAKKKDRLLDHFSRFFSIGAVSLPTFWVALFFQLIFYKGLNLLPIGGRISVEATIFETVPQVTGMLLADCLITGRFGLFLDALRHIILPCITVSLYPIGLVSRMTRSALLEILGEDYMTAGHSYGLSDTRMLWKYALKNSLGTTATDVALSMGYTLTNTFLVEAIFSWPGIGSYISSAVTTLDYPAIIGVTLFGAVCYIILNLLADIIIASDPRVRL